MARKSFITLIGIVTALWMISTFLFRLQGGFDGGHGQYDIIVALPGIPWLWLLDHAPNKVWSHGDYIPLVLLPWILNILSISFAYALIQRSARRRTTN